VKIAVGDRGSSAMVQDPQLDDRDGLVRYSFAKRSRHTRRRHVHDIVAALALLKYALAGAVELQKYRWRPSTAEGPRETGEDGNAIAGGWGRCKQSPSSTTHHDWASSPRSSTNPPGGEVTSNERSPSPHRGRRLPRTCPR